MSDEVALKRLLAEARALATSGQCERARAILDAVGQGERMGDLGPLTALGLPRKLHSAYLHLAKRQMDAVARVGYQYTLVPPAELLEDLFRITDGQTQDIAHSSARPVPKIIHQVWVGNRPVPPTCKAWAEHAERQGYAYRLWREADLAGIGASDHPVFRDMAAVSDLPGAVDVARYIILLREGGIYLDCDWYPGRFDQSFHHRLPLTGLIAMAEDVPRETSAGSLMLANSFIAAPPEHRALKSLLEALPEIRRRLPDAPAWWTTGPLPFTLAARCGPLLLADASFTAGSVKADAGEEHVRELVRKNERAKGGLLLAWKPWDVFA